MPKSSASCSHLAHFFFNFHQLSFFIKILTIKKQKIASKNYKSLKNVKLTLFLASKKHQKSSKKSQIVKISANLTLKKNTEIQKIR